MFAICDLYVYYNFYEEETYIAVGELVVIGSKINGIFLYDVECCSMPKGGECLLKPTPRIIAMPEGYIS